MSDPRTKRIRSQPPDVVVAVGSGDASVEFECYRVVLSFASPYFDALFSADMRENEVGRIEYPDKDPEEWRIFYRFLGHEIDLKEHAVTLIPWFHEFQMERQLRDSDGILAKRVASLSRKNSEGGYDASFWDRYEKAVPEGEYRPSMGGKYKPTRALERRKGAFEEILSLLQLSCKYDLDITLEKADDFMSAAASGLLYQTHDLFHLDAVRMLVQLFSPLIRDEHGTICPEGKSTAFWWALDRKFRQDQLGTLPLDSINENDMLPILLQVEMTRNGEFGKVTDCFHNWNGQITDLLNNIARKAHGPP